MVGVDPGYECVLSYDGAPIKMLRTTVTADRLQALMIYEKLMGADTLEMGFVDYSYKPIKPILTFEEPLMEQALLMTTAPIMYGAQPNLGRYSQPDGPFPNPAELMPMGKIKEAQESYELAVKEAVKDMVDVASSMYESGVDCILLDTVGAAGDADALAGLMTAEILRKNILTSVSRWAWQVNLCWECTVPWSMTRTPGRPLQSPDAGTGPEGRGQYFWNRYEHQHHGKHSLEHCPGRHFYQGMQ